MRLPGPTEFRRPCLLLQLLFPAYLVDSINQSFGIVYRGAERDAVAKVKDMSTGFLAAGQDILGAGNKPLS